MQLSEQDIAKIVAAVAREVIARLQFDNEKDEDVQGTVALVTSFVPSRKSCAAFIEKHFGKGIDCALFGGAKFNAPGFLPMVIDDDDSKAELIEKIAGAKNIVLVTPKLSLLYKLAEGNDEGFVEQTFLRPLLWGRNVSVVLDFEPPKTKRQTFFGKLADAIDMLERMGVKVLAYKPSQAVDAPERKALVTEADVVDAAKRGDMRILAAKDALITPLARDKAQELGVSID